MSVYIKLWQRGEPICAMPYIDKIRLEADDDRAWEVSVEDLVRDLEHLDHLRALQRRLISPDPPDERDAEILAALRTRHGGIA
jgi:hypothetical protein